jgi:hypothetical protein
MAIVPLEKAEKTDNKGIALVLLGVKAIALFHGLCGGRA